MTIRALTDHIATTLAAIYPAPENAAIAALVTEHLLGLNPLQRRMQTATVVPASIETQLATMLPRLLAHEPVQYVLSTAYFSDMELEVTSATLIPRPETEELVQLVTQEWQGQSGLKVLDVGTGSGCIALALARSLPTAHVLAIDISPEALAVAQHNAARYAPAVEFQQVNILAALPADIAPGSLDILVSNPPYVRESERPLMRENVLAWEPTTALFVPDNDPLLFYRRLAEVGRKLLRPGGGIYLEINEGLGVETAALLHDYSEVRVVADMFGRDRMVRASL